MVSLLKATQSATVQAHNQSMSMYRIDDEAFGWAFKLTSKPDGDGATTTITMGFLFRE
jgi:hypothetical protein